MQFKAFINTDLDSYNETAFQRQRIKIVNECVELKMELTCNQAQIVNIKGFSLSELKTNTLYKLYFAEEEGYSPFIIEDEMLSANQASYSALSIYISKNHRTVIFASMLPTEFVNSDVIITSLNDCDYYFNLEHYLQQNFKDYKGQTAHNYMESAINKNFSAACADAHLDMLTSFLVGIIDRHPELLSGEEAAKFRKFKKVFETTTLGKLKTFDEELGAMEETLKIRQLQKEYVQVKADHADRTKPVTPLSDTDEFHPEGDN